jgi:hypothetical protein
MMDSDLTHLSIEEIKQFLMKEQSKDSSHYSVDSHKHSIDQADLVRSCQEET